MTERAEFDQSRDEGNFRFIEASRNAVHEISSEIIDVMFRRFQTHLTDDRVELEEYFESEMPEGASAELYVAPTLVDAPMTGETGFNSALSLKLAFAPLIEGTDPQREGDTMYVYLPLPRADYHYPDPLEETIEGEHGRLIQDGDVPTEMYFEYVPHPDKGQQSTRYIMQRDDTDPQIRYRIFRYTVPHDGDEMHIFGAIELDLSSIGERIAEDTEDAMRLIRMLTNFNEVKQTEANPHPPTAA